MDARKKLNAAAAEFVPGSYKSDSAWSSASGTDEPGEDHVSPAELEELEAAEEWVAMMADIEQMEEDHLVQVALRYAPQAKVAEIQRRCGVRPARLRKGIRTRGATAAPGARGW